MSTRPSMQTFIDDNREDIDILIYSQCPNGILGQLNDNDREEWILNYEPLYMLATQAGVDV